MVELPQRISHSLRLVIWAVRTGSRGVEFANLWSPRRPRSSSSSPSSLSTTSGSLFLSVTVVAPFYAFMQHRGTDMLDCYTLTANGTSCLGYY